MLFDWEFLIAWFACSTWAEISDTLEAQENAGMESDVKAQASLMRTAFLLCITTLYNNPFSLGRNINSFESNILETY